MLNSLVGIFASTARPHEALPLYRRAPELAREVHSPIDEAQALEGARPDARWRRTPAPARPSWPTSGRP
ncbi:hypothetical protein ABH920_007599 [Catenulispora sp. EB89]